MDTLLSSKNSFQLTLVETFHGMSLLLRYFTSAGSLVPIPEESAEFEAQRAEISDEKAQRLAAKLRELNIDPDTI